MVIFFGFKLLCVNKIDNLNEKINNFLPFNQNYLILFFLYSLDI
jgi:hypothetical protein